MTRKRRTFGQRLREKRIEKNFSLRKFAGLVGVSPTYLSRVERDNVMPPTADRVKRMADLLGENSDEWIAFAGRVPEDVPQILQKKPTEMPKLLREASILSSKQMHELMVQLRRIKEGGRRK
jgi:transcriptional regulator with XRE-family HTH domain